MTALIDLPVSRETSSRLATLMALVTEESGRQNLVAASTLEAMWDRHIVDSLQLLPLAPPTGAWLDIGSGAGFPGLAVACARPAETVLVEPRRLRAEFLQTAARKLGVERHTQVIAREIEVVKRAPVAVLSARAVAPLTRLFEIAHHLAEPATTWLLMKGAKAREELEAAQASWQGDFRLVPSLTDPAAAIVVALNVRRRG